jgi:hypothetical protein
MRRTVIATAALAALACVGSARAHHSVSMFDIGKPVWLKGTVVRFEAVNPHVVFALEQRNDDGQTRRWTVEGPGLNTFNRLGLRNDFLQPGDVIEVCGFALKEEVVARSSSRQGTAGLSRPDVHGHVLLMAEGQMQLWGYGKTENCIRPGDQVQRWVSFLNTDRRAAGVWCDRRISPNFPSVAPKAFVDEVNRLLPNLCRK